jgi:hypothetical protein
LHPHRHLDGDPDGDADVDGHSSGYVLRFKKRVSAWL